MGLSGVRTINEAVPVLVPATWVMLLDDGDVLPSHQDGLVDREGVTDAVSQLVSRVPSSIFEDDEELLVFDAILVGKCIHRWV
jgi:hypothetical protein